MCVDLGWVGTWAAGMPACDATFSLEQTADFGVSIHSIASCNVGFRNLSHIRCYCYNLPEVVRVVNSFHREPKCILAKQT